MALERFLDFGGMCFKWERVRNIKILDIIPTFPLRANLLIHFLHVSNTCYSVDTLSIALDKTQSMTSPSSQSPWVKIKLG